MARVSLSIPESLVSDLDFVCANLSVSRSALVATILEDHLSSISGRLERSPSVVLSSSSPTELVRRHLALLNE